MTRYRVINPKSSYFGQDAEATNVYSILRPGVHSVWLSFDGREMRFHPVEVEEIK